MDPFSSRDNTQPYLISTAQADSHFGVTGDKAMALQLPPGNSGQVCFENESTAVVIECLSYGTVTNPVTAENGNEHGPALVDGKSLQRCPSGVVQATPTPKAANACPSVGGGGGGGGVGGGGGAGSDTTSPSVRLRARKRQDIDKLAIVVRSSEDSTVTVRASVSVPGSAARTVRFKTVRRSLAAGVRKQIRLRLKRRAKRAVKRALARGKRLKAKVKITVRDRAGNATVKRLRIRLTD